MPAKSIVGAATAITLLSASILVGNVVGSPVAGATAPTSAFAVIGKISSDADQLAIDMDDDTVYGSSYGSRTLVTIEPGATSGAPSLMVPLPGRPSGLAVDSDDDTVYVRDWSFNNVNRKLWVSAAGSSVDDTVPLNGGLISLAVNSADDTVYGTIVYYQNDDSFVVINGANTDDSTQLRGVGGGTYGVDVDQVTDTVWVAGLDSDTVRLVDGATLAVTPVPGNFLDPRDLVVSSVDHRAYISTTVNGAPTLQKVDSTGTLATWSDPANTDDILSLSLNATGTRVAFGSGNNDDSLWILDTATMQPEGVALSIPAINDTVQAASGLIYVVRYDGSPISVVSEVQGSLSASSAQSGDTLTVSLSPTPAVAAGQPVIVDDSTVSSISFGGFAAPVMPAGANTFSVMVPSGPSGTVEAVATLAGGATLSLGNVTFGGDLAPPAPATPSSPPQGVAAVAGDGSATVSWLAPASTGSFPVSTYLATASPGGHTCLVSALTCEVSGLSNGIGYTFTVKALTGAGWSAESSPSNVVVPRSEAKPTIVISGVREGRRIVVAGSFTGLDAGSILTPHVARSLGDFSARLPFPASADGSITWSRRASASVVWRVYLSATDGVRSNTVTIR